MTNQEVAWKLMEVALFLELKGEKKSIIQEVKKVAKLLLNISSPLDLKLVEQLADKNNIKDWLKEDIITLIQQGYSPMAEKLQKVIPTGLVEMLAIPNLKISDINLIYKKMGIKDTAKLEDAAKKRKIRKLPGIGSKAELAIIRGLKMIRENMNRAPIGIAKQLGEELVEDLAGLPQVQKIQLVGESRRGEEMVTRVEVAIVATDPEAVLEIAGKHPIVKKVMLKNETELTFVSKNGVMATIMIVPKENFGGYIHLLTGTVDYLTEVAKVAHKYGIELAELDSYSFEDEEALFEALKLPFIQPELRDGEEIVHQASANKLPELINKQNIKGDLHCHTDWSDGIAGIEEVAKQAKQQGYEYLAITDHSKSLSIAGGLSDEKLRKQGDEIATFNASNPDFCLFRGVEADILLDGRIDYDDDLLSEMDLVIASVHSGFQMEAKEMTDRITTAIKNEHVNILAHPTGRILGARKGYQVNIDEIIDVAVKTNTVLEINSSIDRLDLNHQLARHVEDAGGKLAINTDSHDPGRFTDIEYGVTVAQKARLKQENVINTYECNKLKSFLAKQKNKK